MTKPEDTEWKLSADKMGSESPEELGPISPQTKVEEVGGEAGAKSWEPFFLAKMYTCRCGYCGATEGMVDPNEVCSASTPDEMHPHRFGVFAALAQSDPVKKAGLVGDMGPRSCEVCGEHYSVDDDNIECPFCDSVETGAREALRGARNKMGTLAFDAIPALVELEAQFATLTSQPAATEERGEPEWLRLVLALNALPKGATLYHTADGGWTLYSKDGAGERLKFGSAGDLLGELIGQLPAPASPEGVESVSQAPAQEKNDAV